METEIIHTVCYEAKIKYDCYLMCVNCSQHNLEDQKYFGKYLYTVDFGLQNYPYALMVPICEECNQKIIAKSAILGSVHEGAVGITNSADEGLCNEKCKCKSTIEDIAKHNWDFCESACCKICTANSD